MNFVLNSCDTQFMQARVQIRSATAQDRHQNGSSDYIVAPVVKHIKLAIRDQKSCYQPDIFAAENPLE